MRTINHIVIHATASSQVGQPQQLVASILSNFTNRLKWAEPGYHILVSPVGSIHPIWPLHRIANGVRGYNAHSIHIAYIGGINGSNRGVDNRTALQKEALVMIIRALRAQGITAPVVGHYDLSQDLDGNGRIDPHERMKECPCFDATTEYQLL